MHFWVLTKYSKLLTFFKRENFSTSKVLIYEIAGCVVYFSLKLWQNSGQD